MTSQQDDHEDECECEVCKNGFEAFRRKEAELIEKVGWLIHFVSGYPGGLVNIHTHNLENHEGHKDLQIVVPIDDQTANWIMHGVVKKIEQGATFKEGDRLEGVLKGMPIGFIDAKDGARDVLRLILPDKNGVIEKGKIEPMFDMQFETLPGSEEA